MPISLARANEISEMVASLTAAEFREVIRIFGSTLMSGEPGNATLVARDGTVSLLFTDASGNNVAQFWSKIDPTHQRACP